MNYIFSAKNNAFYPVDMKDDYVIAGTWPEDGTLVDDEVFSKYALNLPPVGKIRGSEAGLPVWIDAPSPSHDEIVAIAEQKKSALRATADSEIAWRQDAVDVAIATEEEIDGLSKWKKYRVLLMRVDISKAPDINWPEIPA